MKASNREIARAYIALFNDSSAELDRFEAFLSPDVVYEEMPNLLAPEGSVRDRDEMLSGVVQGRELLSEQEYRIITAIGQDDVVALEVEWEGRLAMGFGGVAAGSFLRARIAMFLTFAGGKIIHQRNYDAYDPLA